MTQITFRPARASDRAVYPWRLFGMGQYRPTVVTLNGKIILILEGETVVYQNGTDGIPDVIRAWKDLARALGRGLIDHEAAHRELQERFRATMASFQDES